MDLIKLSDKEILEYIAPGGKLIPARCVKSVLVKHRYYDYIIRRYDNNTLDETDSHYLREILYRILHHIDVPPVCKICGKPLKFTGIGYPQYCSRSCSNQDPEVLKKISDSCSESLKNAYREKGKEIKEKRKQTLSKNLGVELDSPTPFASKEIQVFSKKRIHEKYGVDNIFQLDWVKKRAIESQRYQSVKIQKERGIDIEYLENGNYLVKNCCPMHGDLEFTPVDFSNRFKIDRYYNSTPCYICNPFGYHISGMEKTLGEYIKSIYSGEIIENDKSVLSGKEIDIYLPDLKIGFEFNGDYWHMNPLKYGYNDTNPSSKKKAYEIWSCDRNKILCANEKGIKLYTIWEYYFSNYKSEQLDFISNIINGNIEYTHPLIKLKDELMKIDSSYVMTDGMIFDYENLRVVYMDGFYFNNKSITNRILNSFMSKTKRTIFVYDYEICDRRKFDVILSDIKYALGQIDKRVYARKCKLVELSNSDVKQFLLDNSLFGFRPATVTLGLYYENELVMVYSFGNNFYGRKKDTEVIRVATKKNTQVIGGSSKCLNYYLKKYSTPGENIIFYVDKIHHSGSSMPTGDFEFVRHNYGYVNYYISFDRFGESFNRTPKRNNEVKKLIESGKLVKVPTYGVDVYKKTVK